MEGVERREGWSEIYESDSSDGELNPSVCSLTAINLRREGLKPVQGFAGVCRSLLVCESS